MYFFFSFFTFTSCILVMWPFDIHCTYIWFISTNLCYSPIFTCVVSFLSLSIWFLYIVCNLLFLFHTKMQWRVLFKVFQKYRLSKSSYHKLSLQNFSRVCVMIDFIVFNEYELSDLWLLSYVHLFVVILSWIAKWEDCYDICDLMLGIYVNIELTNPLIKCTLLIIW